MAKAKKPALVPEAEQPYAVPENWVWTRLGNIFEMKSGKFISASDIHQDNDGTRYPCYGGNGLRGYVDTYNTDGSFPLIGRQGALCGNINMAHGKFYATEHAVVTKPILDTNMSWAYHILNELNLNQYATATAQPGLAVSKIAAIPIPLPPLPEQHRIVTRIESLFAKLDRAKELAQSALDRFEMRKAAILHQAFTGALTAQWREAHGVGLDSWEEKALDDVCVSIYDGDHMPPPKSETGVPFLVISNINQGYVSFQKTRFVPEEYYNNLSETRTPQVNDILYSVTGSFGIPALLETDEPFCFQRHIALLRPDKAKLSSKCFWYILQTQEIFNQADSIATGTAQRTVPIKGLRKISFKFPTLPEQEEIVRILDSLLEKEHRARELCDVIAQVGLMKKAILARAFRGELGTGDPGDESAVELLREHMPQ